MAKKIAKKKKRVVVKDEDEVVPESPVHDTDQIVSSPKKASPIHSNVEVTGYGDHSKISTPIKDAVIPPGVSNTKLVTKEVRTLGIPANISNMDTNGTMGEGVLNNEAQGNPTIAISSTFDTSTISTNIYLPLFVSTISTTLPPTTHSPTYHQILQQPITSLFPSQSTDGPKIVNDDDTTVDGEFTGTFDDLEFDPEEENIPDHMLMSGGCHLISKIEVDVMLKAQELRLRDELEILDRNNEKHVKAQSSSFDQELKELKVVPKEKHILFVQDVKKVREDVNLKLEELRVDIAKEVAAISHDYSIIPKNVDIIADAVTDVIGSSSSLTIPDSLPQKCVALESTLKHELAPLAKLLNLMPMNVPPIQKGVQGREGIGAGFGVSSKFSMGGKGVVVEPTAEEKKATIEKEIEKQRHIQSILQHRASDPPGLDKGDPSKHY
ncbi:unnamed protein product [Lactuca saligna]|uniref:Uncharacterized protein n=1 Tax=Lactuca saligna TaxID=75948 RepID=A0AA35Z3H1_LACSI|nr:unnamed protein product [Lactuca saligna]